FINTHCHLELSHMKGKVDTGTKLLPFLKAVVSYRNVDEDLILQAISEADLEMYNAGIVAVGDTSNKLDTKIIKDASALHYHTFVEMFDFLNEKNARRTFDGYLPILEN